MRIRGARSWRGWPTAPAGWAGVFGSAGDDCASRGAHANYYLYKDRPLGQIRCCDRLSVVPLLFWLPRRKRSPRMLMLEDFRPDTKKIKTNFPKPLAIPLKLCYNNYTSIFAHATHAIIAGRFSAGGDARDHTKVRRRNGAIRKWIFWKLSSVSFC